jgi:hypothetical protein
MYKLKKKYSITCRNWTTKEALNVTSKRIDIPIYTYITDHIVLIFKQS